ncbi:MAG: hypothetical protein ACRC5H_05130 [Treponemataceae bacterium]
MNIFEIIGPVMIRPSSSHTAGACRLGFVAHKIRLQRRLLSFQALLLKHIAGMAPIVQLLQAYLE